MYIKLLKLIIITIMINACNPSKNKVETNSENQNEESVIDKALNNEIKCNGKDKKNQLSLINVKGKVKYILEKEYSAVYNFEKIEKENESVLYHNVVVYDINGNEIYSLNYHPNDGTEGQKYISKYDEFCNKTEEIGYNENDQFTGKYIFIYENGNNIEKQFFDKNNTLCYKNKYKFNNIGNIVEDVTIGKEGLRDKSFHKYDDKNNVIETECYEGGGKFIGKWNYQYDEFDSEGNYTRKITFYKDKPQNIRIREIEYYK